MAEITAGMVRDLRERTGAGMMDCKKALVENGGDMEAAIFDQRLFAIHHACAGALAQVTHHTRCDFSHWSSPLLDD